MRWAHASTHRAMRHVRTARAERTRWTWRRAHAATRTLCNGWPGDGHGGAKNGAVQTDDHSMFKTGHRTSARPELPAPAPDDGNVARCPSQRDLGPHICALALVSHPGQSRASKFFCDKPSPPSPPPGPASRAKEAGDAHDQATRCASRASPLPPPYQVPRVTLTAPRSRGCDLVPGKVAGCVRGRRGGGSRDAAAGVDLKKKSNNYQRKCTVLH